MFFSEGLVQRLSERAELLHRLRNSILTLAV
jgi:hypothetical protein